MNPRIAIVTASYGGVDKIYPPEPQSVPCEWHCFGCQADGWQCHDWPVARKEHGDVYQAKLPKILPELILPQQYEWYLWMDASCHITSPDFLFVRLSEVGLASWLVCNHHIRTTVKEEVGHSLKWERYAEEPLQTMYGHYLRMGFEDTRLYANTWFLRRSTEQTRAICSDWMNQILLWSYQDQVSLPYVFWKHRFKPRIATGTCWTSLWHTQHGHKTAKYW